MHGHTTSHEQVRQGEAPLKPATGDTVGPRDTSEAGTGTGAQEEGIGGGKK